MMYKKSERKVMLKYVLLLLLLAGSNPGWASKCMLVMSYHKGYAWNDGVETGVRKLLSQKCELTTFYMDTKRNKGDAFAKKQALLAKQQIEDIKPDVVIATDDNASRYLVMPYYKDAELPIVFCAVNWTAKKYGYPYKNVTGMIEVAPIQPLLEVVKKTVNNFNNAIYLGADTFTERKNFNRFRDVYGRQGVNVEGYFAKNLNEWASYFSKAQSADFIILGSNAGINDWDRLKADEIVQSSGKTFTVTNHHWMSPYTMFSITKIPEEQGEWAGEVALAILGGMQPSQIPIRANRKWRTYINQYLLKLSGISIPEAFTMPPAE